MDNLKIKPGIGFWIISSIALLWNLMGVNQYILMAYKSESVRVGLTPEKLALIDATPMWATGAFAVAVFAGALGSIALLLRKKVAHNLFLISLFGIIVQNIDAFMRLNLSDYNTAELSMTILIMVFALYLIFYSKKAITVGWLR